MEWHITLTKAKTYGEMDELEKAKADMDYMRHKGGFAYKQAKAHYEKVRRRDARADKPIRGGLR